MNISTNFHYYICLEKASTQDPKEAASFAYDTGKKVAVKGDNTEPIRIAAKLKEKYQGKYLCCIISAHKSVLSTAFYHI